MLHVAAFLHILRNEILKHFLPAPYLLKKGCVYIIHICSSKVI